MIKEDFVATLNQLFHCDRNPKYVFYYCFHNIFICYSDDHTIIKKANTPAFKFVVNHLIEKRAGMAIKDNCFEPGFVARLSCMGVDNIGSLIDEMH